ncbi:MULTISPECIES: SDR family NAD(P)-dependent oxidoreductase [Dyadobacter]|uniref:SDR family NAD(P)-dependent oxidoreductase n=1 Tax=Dyadobacter chenhuakuii TaxID=2909339 RepID=A0A9X1QI63_9BACT|nr:MULTISPECIES: SDR family NAD(P)-dependent oxidoreductase [Dyadobacter]MCF2501299.1 SDR family NAD(P)-dependent oxidoreductase [Dyadobacter chenhuakuii]MCF2502122.1 SDR family NAD(P)-dependent oxidoreductase [Dyadobacter fanqingshengii]
MARVFITGFVDGLGQLTANALVHKGHSVVLHARNRERSKYGLAMVPGAEAVLTGDLSSIEETINLAAQVNRLGNFDAVIHNAGVYQVQESKLTQDGLPPLFAINTIAPYILTCLIKEPKHLIYTSSGMHKQADPNLTGLNKESLNIAYSDSKFHNLILAMAVARLRPAIYANAVDPGWVPTKLGGTGAPDNLDKGFATQVWLAVSSDEQAKISGKYLHHQKPDRYLRQADQVVVQEKFLSFCQNLTSIAIPFGAKDVTS